MDSIKGAPDFSDSWFSMLYCKVYSLFYYPQCETHRCVPAIVSASVPKIMSRYAETTCQARQSIRVVVTTQLLVQNRLIGLAEIGD